MNSIWTGIQASFEFTTDERSRNDSQLRISPGDKIYAQYTDRTLPRPYSTDDDKEIFGTAFIQANLGKPIDFDKVEVTKSIYFSSQHEKSVSISTTIDAKNDYETNLHVYMLYQISDEDGRAIHIDWSRVFAPAEGTFTVYHNCDVLKSGKYTVDIFVFNNLENPVPYSTKFSETIFV